MCMFKINKSTVFPRCRYINAQTKSIFKNRGTLYKGNCHPWATVHFCTQHHCTVSPWG